LFEKINKCFYFERMYYISKVTENLYDIYECLYYLINAVLFNSSKIETENGYFKQIIFHNITVFNVF